MNLELTYICDECKYNIHTVNEHIHSPTLNEWFRCVVLNFPILVSYFLTFFYTTFSLILAENLCQVTSSGVQVMSSELII